MGFLKHLYNSQIIYGPKAIEVIESVKLLQLFRCLKRTLGDPLVYLGEKWEEESRERMLAEWSTAP